MFGEYFVGQGTLIGMLALVALVLVSFLVSSLSKPSKRKARRIRKTMPIHALLEQADQGLSPMVYDGDYVYFVSVDSFRPGFYTLVNPKSLRTINIGNVAGATAFLRAWGYREVWGRPDGVAGYKPKKAAEKAVY